MKLFRLFAAAVAAFGIAATAQAQQPIKIGIGIAQTGALGGGGKAALLALQIWRDDVNAKGGLLGRKLELISYDDQTNPAIVPGIYTKLLDIDKVDLLIAPYGTNVTAPIMPLVKQRDKLLMGNFSFDVNAQIKHDKWFNNAPWGAGALAWGGPFLDAAEKLGGKSIAFMAADAEFAQNLCTGGRAIAKAKGLQVVYDQNYPPNSVDFSSIIRSVRAAKADIVFICSYPAESAAIVRAVAEIGVGPTVKIIGGGMVGLQFAPIMEALGPLLNGFVNYNSYVPEKTMENPAVKAFLERYSVRAKQEKVDPLGFYLPPFNYAIGQMYEQAINATKSLDHKVLADYIRKNEMKTMVGSIKYDTVGEWTTPRVVMAQFRGIKGKDLEQFRQPGKQVIIAPASLKSGDLLPFDKARD
ncbi:MAG: branched-chain amino acid ABC transporter substrate-binding protein [Betaproteobacteria bacterium]|nr:branched-chain amino acid ABC transporter substrate-binding protein [Betaproteobacteria bacterium]